MTVRIRYKTEAVVSSSNAGEEDLGKPLAAITIDTQGKGGTWKTTLAPGAVDVQLLFPNVTNLRFIWLRSSPNDPTIPLTGLLMRRNSNLGEQWPLDPLPGAKEAQWMLTTSGFTALFASNPGTAVIDVTISIAGD